MRKVLIAIGVVIIILVLAVGVLAMFVDADRFRPQIEHQATQALGRQVTIGKLKLALFSGGVSAEDLAIADDPAYSNQPFVTAKSMGVGVDLGALILHRQLNVRSFTLHAPKLVLIEKLDAATQKKTWNLETLAKKKAGAPEEKPAAKTEFEVQKFLLDDGEVTLKHQATGKSSTYSKLRFEADNVSLTQSFPFKFSVVPAGGGSVEAKGTFGPMAEQTAQTPLKVDVKVRDLNMAATGFTADSALKGIADLDLTLASDGKRVDVTSKLTGKKLCLVAGCQAIDTPIIAEMKASYGLADQLFTVPSGTVKIGGSSAQLGGNIDMKGAEPKLDMKVTASSMAVSDVEKALPAIGVILPSGAKLEGGMASLNAVAKGAAKQLVTSGHVAVLNTKVTGYDLGTKLAVVTKLAGVSVGKETAIQEFSSDFEVTPSLTTTKNVLLVVPSIGRMTGDGTIDGKNQLNYAMKASVDISKSAVGVVASALGRKNTNLNVPFHVAGTTSNPSFTPDAGKVLGSTGNATKDAGKSVLGGLGGLFGKKK